MLHFLQLENVTFEAPVRGLLGLKGNMHLQAEKVPASTKYEYVREFDRMFRYVEFFSI